MIDYMLASAEADYRERQFNSWFNLEPVVAPKRVSGLSLGRRSKRAK